MKTRYSLVSNSSASSFCIYGCQLDNCNLRGDPEEFIRITKKMKQEFPKDFQEALDEIKEKYGDRDYYKKEFEVLDIIGEVKITDARKLLMDDPDDDYESGLIDYFLNHFKLYYHYDYDYGSGWIGKRWQSIKDDETGAHFKLGVEEIIKSLFGKDCSTIEEAFSQ